jgi:hypothetical protein
MQCKNCHGSGVVREYDPQCVEPVLGECYKCNGTGEVCDLCHRPIDECQCVEDYEEEP